MIPLKPHSLATRTHWLQSRFVGSKNFGSSFPKPVLRPVKVFMPKWVKSVNSSSCHASWAGEGIGSSGLGASAAKTRAVQENVNRLVAKITGWKRFVLRIEQRRKHRYLCRAVNPNRSSFGRGFGGSARFQECFRPRKAK